MARSRFSVEMRLLAAVALIVTAVAKPIDDVVPDVSKYNRVFEIQAFKKLEDLPGADLINPKSKAPTKPPMKILVDWATITGPVGNGQPLITFKSPIYYDARNPEAYALPFAPTYRVVRDKAAPIQIFNGLLGGAGANTQVRGFVTPGDTNLHAHGMHHPTGIWNIQRDVLDNQYVHGDNIVKHLVGRTSESDPIQNFTYKPEPVPGSHMPGHHWYHPHKHSSVTLQTGTAHGVIIVDDDHKAWLPDDECKPIVKVLTAAKDVVLDFSLYPFKYWADETLASGDTTTWAGTPEWLTLMDNSNVQWASKTSTPGSPWCCSTDFSGTATVGWGQDFMLVNGGFQPIITMNGGEWQRWRLLFSGMKGYFVLEIRSATSNAMGSAPECEMMMVGKDGSYLMQIPRKIPAALMVSGGRVEVLVRCNAEAGAKYILSAGTSTTDPNPFSDNGFGYNPGPGAFPAQTMKMSQDVLATIEIAKSKGKGSASVDIVEKACTPRRPGYAADLRDENLQKYGLAVDLTEQVGFGRVTGKPSSCGMSYRNNPPEFFTLPDFNIIQMPIGAIVQWDFNNSVNHPLHMHINPFQLVALPTNLKAGCQWTSFFEVGDYHDTLLVPMVNGATTQMPLRFQVGEFAGYTVVHCHYLNHEDGGCMKLVMMYCPGDDQNGVSYKTPYHTVMPGENINSPMCPGFQWKLPGNMNGKVNFGAN